MPAQGQDYIAGMNRSMLAVIGGILGFSLYVAAAVVLADPVLRLHWSLQAVYFVVAGVAWVGPMRWLMLWAARLRG